MIFWKEEEVTQARKLHAAGMTYAKIAAGFPDRTADAVRYVIKRWGIRVHSRKPRRTVDRLLPALARSITRYATDNGIDMSEAINRLLFAGELR